MIRARSGKTAGRLVLGAGVLAMLIPAIAGCEAGNDAPTLEFHSANAGASASADSIQISNAFVLGAPSGATVPSGSSVGMFLSLYNGGNNPDTLESVSVQGAGKASLSGGSVALPASASANLTGPQPEVVVSNLAKPLNSGGVLPVTFTFQHAGTVQVQVPVMAQSYYYSTFSPPAGSSSGSVSPGSSATAPALGGSSSATPGGTASGTPSGSATPTSTP